MRLSKLWNLYDDLHAVLALFHAAFNVYADAVEFLDGVQHGVDDDAVVADGAAGKRPVGCVFQNSGDAAFQLPDAETVQRAFLDQLKLTGAVVQPQQCAGVAFAEIVSAKRGADFVAELQQPEAVPWKSLSHVRRVFL